MSDFFVNSTRSTKRIPSAPEPGDNGTRRLEREPSTARRPTRTDAVVREQQEPALFFGLARDILPQGQEVSPQRGETPRSGAFSRVSYYDAPKPTVCDVCAKQFYGANRLQLRCSVACRNEGNRRKNVKSRAARASRRGDS